LDAGAIESSYLVEDVLGACGLLKAGVSLGKAVASRGFVKNVVNKIAQTTTQRQGSRSGFHGHKGFELKNPKYQKVRNHPTTIHDRPYSGHALDQMQNRGLTPSVVEETIQNGVATPNKAAGRMQFHDPINNISVITENGRVVTVMHGRAD
jgi:hypothetical protein